MLNLAIIGAGIGGCSAAYFAYKHLPYSKVTVYEMEDRIGGRVLTFDMKKMKNEIGAAFFTPINKTVCNIVREMKLNTKKLEDPMDIAVYDGTNIIFRSDPSKFYSMLKLFSKYKVSLLKLLLTLRKVNGKIKKWYAKDRDLEFWEIFESIGLDKWYKKPLDQILLEIGLDKDFIDEIITPITRIIYSQNAELGGFAGISSLLGVYGKSMYSLEEGNESLPRKLLEISNCKINLKCKVKSIEKTTKDTFRVTSEENSSIFDGVIVATPLEVADIFFDGVEKQKRQPREYQKIYIKVMKGFVNSKYFNLDPSTKLPSIILTSKKTDPITRFSIKKSKKHESWVTVTSTKPIDHHLLDGLFKNGEAILDHTWKAAYPVFKPIKKIPHTYFDKGLVYLNAIESAASSLETSSFAALNSIKTIKKQLKS